MQNRSDDGMQERGEDGHAEGEAGEVPDGGRRVGVGGAGRQSTLLPVAP